MEQPTIRNDLVSGVCYNQEATPDRHFYLYDESSDLVFEADGYKQPLEEGADPRGQQWIIMLLCPACHQVLRIDSTKKQVEVSPRGLETGEPIGCTYWLDDVDGYTGPCPFKFAEFAPPKEPEFIEVRTTAGQRQRVKIDAFVRARYR